MSQNKLAPTLGMSAVLLLLMPFSLSAQNEQALKAFFEGRPVTVRIDMPASKEGIDVYPKRRPAIDFKEYGDRIKKYGIAVHNGETILITRIKKKGKHIEFQLGGGGYGTFWDESGSVSAGYVEKSKREKELEKLAKIESDSEKKKELKRELDALRTERQREQRRLDLQAKEAEEAKKARIREKAREAGSRFNIRYDYSIAARELTPETVIRALNRYVDFPAQEFGGIAGTRPTEGDAALRPRVDPVPGKANRLRKGLLWEEAAQLYGAPKSVSERMEGSLKVMTCVFEQGGNLLKMEFVEGVLIRYTIPKRRDDFR